MTTEELDQVVKSGAPCPMSAELLELNASMRDAYSDVIDEVRLAVRQETS